MKTSNIDLKTVSIALSALESLEIYSLVWGLVDSYINEDELLSSIRDAFEIHNIDNNPVDVICELEELRLVRYWIYDGNRCYRSRFAELVRLIANSRQLLNNRSWRSSPSLVSDYRIDISPRRFPKRNICFNIAKINLEKNGLLFTDIQNAVWHTIFASNAMPFLSQFQVDAIIRIFSTPKNCGTIITSGTGSGKTLSFYLPALLAVIERLKINVAFTKVLCIYPRIELLKDQFCEVYKLCNIINPVLLCYEKPKFSFGSYFSKTPHSPNKKSVEQFCKWVWKKNGYICPFMRCPICGADTVWKNDDLIKQYESLSCTECYFISLPEELRLTRQSILKTPPDFLFTTTEMLNQRMSDTQMRGIFGIGCPSNLKPSFILLDEIHSYSGISGAQTALMLRRWRKMLSSSVHWVGLSATLEGAVDFFENLTGVHSSNIQEISPKKFDMEEEGADYQIIVRSDPTSQTATLSTSIQVLMLLARMLDPVTNKVSKGLFGSKVFAFTDNLDVTHRLYDDFRDAESYKPWGKNVIDLNRKPLAALRAKVHPDDEERDRDGQLWSLAEDLRKGLHHPMKVGRTTSRDPGVQDDSDVIVATASLEVGFNDPNVGAILQHKTPHSNASFIQRKGRAGRQRNMRPIMVTVLSDYGRDRIAFQSYEELFSPLIETLHIPVNNKYILRMQAIYALFDWIALIASQEKISGWSWNELSMPRENISSNLFLKIAHEIIRDLLKLDPDRLNAFQSHLVKCLNVDKHTVDLLFWEQPRSLLLEALPTLQRRLDTNWSLAKNLDKSEYFVSYHPLPEFIPRQLFSELNLPEVTIIVPPGSKFEILREERVNIHLALSEFIPGKVRRRFADSSGNISHWFPIDPEEKHQVININDFAERSEYLGIYPVKDIGSSRMYRPLLIRVENILAKQKISHSSTAKWNWQSDFEFTDKFIVVKLKHHTGWEKILPKLKFYLHRLACGVTVRRYAHNGIAQLQVNGQTNNIEFKLVEDDMSTLASIGFSYQSDGICIPLILPCDNAFEKLVFPNEVYRWLATLHYKDSVLNDNFLSKILNQFKCEWLMQIVLHAALTISEEMSIELAVAFDKISLDDNIQALESSIAQIISSEIVFDKSEIRNVKLEKTLYFDLKINGVLQRICQIGSTAFSSTVPNKGKWLRRIFVQTVAEAALHACILSSPKNSALGDLAVDLIENNDEWSILIVETTLGGGGSIEALSEIFSGDSRAFYKLLEAALAPSDAENAAIGLKKILNEITENGEIRDRLKDLRFASESKKREKCRINLANLLSSKGVQYSRALGVSFATRFVKQSSSSSKDDVIKKLFEFWNILEGKYNICLPIRLITSLACINSSIKSSLTAIGGAGNEMTTAERLLWARGGELRQYSIQSYNVYRDNWISDTALARTVVSGSPVQVISIDYPNWSVDANNVLVNSGIVALITNVCMEDLIKVVIDYISRPITVDYHNFYPIIEAYHEKEDGPSELLISLKEKV